jgi:hypothetical protein
MNKQNKKQLKKEVIWLSALCFLLGTWLTAGFFVLFF